MRGADTTVVKGGPEVPRERRAECKRGDLETQAGTEAQTGGKSSFPIRGTGERCGGPFSPLPQLQWGFRLGESSFIQ